jgi:signal transduction protein with GAF and PtsI domain
MNTDTPRTNTQIVLCNYGKERVCADFARGLERELIAFKRSNERIIHDYNMLARDTRYAEAMQRAAERDAIAAIDREKQMEEQRNTLNETCQSLRVQVGDLRNLFYVT